VLLDDDDGSRMDRIGRLNGALPPAEIDLSPVAHGAEAAVARVKANQTMNGE
jgi:hypothetical protein